MMESRILTADEMGVLRKHLDLLASYHNEVAEAFPGVYPIVPLDQALADSEEMVREGQARAEALFDDDGEVAGYCVVHRHGDTGDVDWIYVREDMREQGWGRKLLENGLAYLKENGVKLVDLEVVRGNPAKDFYHELGFDVRLEVMTKRLS